MKNLKCFVLLLSLISLSACNESRSPSTPQDAINSLTLPKDPQEVKKTLQQGEAILAQALKNSNDKEIRYVTQKLIQLYQKASENAADSNQKAEYLFHAAGYFIAPLRNFLHGIKIYEKIVKQYPQTRIAPRALFMQGYVYANELKNYKKAQQIYQKFLKKYSNDPLSTTVQQELQFLGKSAEEIMQSWQKDTTLH